MCGHLDHSVCLIFRTVSHLYAATGAQEWTIQLLGPTLRELEEEAESLAGIFFNLGLNPPQKNVSKVTSQRYLTFSIVNIYVYLP